MNKKPQLRYKGSTRSWDKNNCVAPFSRPDPIEEERHAQQQEHHRKQKRGFESFSKKKYKHKPNKSPKSQSMKLEENLERTWKWLSETFPVLFATNSTIKLLDTHIIRDIKDHYKRYQVQNRYPKDLIIKAALSRYMEKREYLLCLQEGSSKYDIHGNAVETITQAEQEEALQRLERSSKQMRGKSQKLSPKRKRP
ncbi:MAG: ProQ/FINO family protein [Thermodesulfobium sp.]